METSNLIKTRLCLAARPEYAVINSQKLYKAANFLWH